MTLSTQIHWMSLAERSITLWAMALVVSGHMLPSGSASAQDLPSLSIPVNAQAAEPTPVETSGPATPVDARPALKSAEPASQLPVIQPAISASPASRTEAKYSFDQWTVMVRSAPQPSVRQAPRHLTPPGLVSNVKVPVHVQVNNAAPQIPLLWNVNSTYSPWWQAPTNAYLFRRPQPYWQLRGDFFHLAPFINW